MTISDDSILKILEENIISPEQSLFRVSVFSILNVPGHSDYAALIVPSSKVSMYLSVLNVPSSKVTMYLSVLNFPGSKVTI